MSATRTLVGTILGNWENLKWRIGTTGVFTLTLSDDIAINVFDHSRAVRGCADYHSHWYDFSSMIVAGEFRHYRYITTCSLVDVVEEIPVLDQEVSLDHKATGDPKRCWLRQCSSELYGPGQSYEITAPEIHRVIAVPGTVTLVTRQRRTNPACYHIFKDAAQPAAAPEVVKAETAKEIATGFIALAMERLSAVCCDHSA